MFRINCTKGIVLLYLDQIAALQLTVQIHSTIGRNLRLSFFQFTITDLQSIFQSRKLPELTIGNIQKAAILQAKIFFLRSYLERISKSCA